MALVIKNEMLEGFLTDKMLITDGVTTNVIADGVTHMDIVTYPAQEGFENGAILALIKKPFINFAQSCGAAGAMTAASIQGKYGEAIPEILATAIAADFAKAYGNYVIIPDGMTLMFTAPPYNSVFELTKPEPVPNDDAIDVEPVQE